MVRSPRRGKKRRPRNRRKPGVSGNRKILLQSIAGGMILIVIVFLIAAGVIDSTVGTIIGMIIVAIIFYFVSLDSSQSRSRRRKRRRRPKPEAKDDPQFYTALPSTLGLTELPDESPKQQIKLPPRPIRAARRRRDFVTYPLAVSGGDYSDSYIQVDKDTVLRLRSEMTPESSLMPLSGLRLDAFPSPEIAAVMSKELDSVDAAPVAVDAAPVAVDAAPVAVDAAPVPVQSSPTDDEEEEMEFDMEWE